jgi:tetratricopeptide (TPR) repeat protein
MRPRPRLALILLVLGAAGGSAARASTPAELFARANGAYEEGKYEEAATAYATILDYGVTDPRVLYNLGNAYFKMARLGPAILNYERALRIDPADQDARDNLEFARGRIRDRVPEPEAPYPVQVLQGALDALSSNLVSVIFLAAYLVASGLAGALPLVRSDLRRRVIAYTLAAAGMGVALAGGALAYKIRDDASGRAIVMQDRVDVLSGPAADNTVLFTVHEGTRLQIRNRLDGWCQVSLPNALSGWVQATSVEQV